MKVLKRKDLLRIETKKSQKSQKAKVKEVRAKQDKVISSTQITIEQVRGKKVKTRGKLRVRTTTHDVVDRFLKAYHYLPEHRIVGRQINHKVVDRRGLIVAVVVWSNTPAMAIKSREVYMGWDGEHYRRFRRKQVNRIIANNSRYCVHPHIANRKNLASHILRLSRDKCVKDWKRRFKDDLLFFETFVDTDFYQGICYRADNWIQIGETKGSSWHGTRVLKGKGMGDRWSILGRRKGLTEGAVSKKLIFLRPVYKLRRSRSMLKKMAQEHMEKGGRARKWLKMKR